MVKVAIVARHALAAEGMQRLLDETFEVVANALDLVDLANLVESQSLEVDVVLAHMPPDKNYELSIKHLRAIRPKIHIIALWEEENVERMILRFWQGCDGLLLSKDSLSKLKQAIHLVCNGEKVFPSQLLTWLAEHVPSSAYQAVFKPSTVVNLTRREWEVLSHVALGQSNKEIANEMGLTESTVKMHLKMILRKIHTENRTQAAMWAIRHGVVANKGGR